MAGHPKRTLDEADPDYENLEGQEVKRLRLQEEDGRHAACKKIQAIIQREFQAEISNKERELQQVDMRLNDARLMLDRLRAVVVANYYGLAGQSTLASHQASSSSRKSEVQSIHPAVKKLIGKAPKDHPTTSSGSTELQETSSSAVSANPEVKERLCHEVARNSVGMDRAQSALLAKTSAQVLRSNSPSLNPTFDDRRARLKIKRKIIVGNVSKYIPVDQRESNDMSSHKWMVYVRGPKSDPDISNFVKRVWFFLHHSYKPNDLVEVSNAPFHLTRRGWGEFPVRVQLHFVDPRNKKVDIFHHLKLDKTFTGLQKLGGETVVELDLERDFFEDSQAAYEKPATTLPVPKSTSLASSSSSSSLSSSLLSSQKEAVSARTTARPLSSPSTKEPEEKKSVESSRTSATPLMDKIKMEIIIPTEGANDDELENSKISNKAEREFPSSKTSFQMERPHHNHQQHQQTAETKTLVGTIAESETTMSKAAGNVKTELTCTSPAVASNQQDDEEYNVTITHASTEDERVNANDSLIVCDDESPTGLLSTKNHPCHQISAYKLVQGTSKPASEKSKSSSALLDCATSTHHTANSRANPRQNTPSLSSPTQSPISVSMPIPSESPSRVPTSIIPLATFPKPVHLITASGVSPSILKLEPMENGGTPLGLQVNASFPNNPNLPVVTATSVAKSGSMKIISKPSLTPSHALKPTSAHSLKAVNFSLVNKTSPSPELILPPNAVILRPSAPHVQTGKVISRTNVSAAMSQNQLKYEEQMKSPMVVRVGPQSTLTSPSQIMFVRPNVIKPTPTPTVTNAPSPRQLSSKKQVSLLTGAIVNPHQKAVHSSNVNSLLKPGTCRFADGSDNHKVVQKAGIALTMPIRSVNDPLNASINPAPQRGGIPLPAAIPASNSLQQRQSLLAQHPGRVDGNALDISSLELPSMDIKMSAIGITKIKHVNQQRQAIARMRNTGDIIEGRADDIRLLNPNDFPDLRCLTKAAIRLHPLVQANVNKLTHPYCAESREQWESWPIGKQRASEWHRACFALKFIRHCLGGTTQFKGEQLMSTRQLVQWCRLHAFSPQPPLVHRKKQSNTDLRPNDFGIKEEGDFSPQDSDLRGPLHLNTTPELKSFTKLKDALTILQGMSDSMGSEKSQQEFHVDVVGNEKQKTPSTSTRLTGKKEADKGIPNGCTLLPESDGADFVVEWTRQRGIKFCPQELERGVLASTAADMVFQSMLEFGADILRKAVCVSAEQDRPTGDLSVEDAHGALVALPEASFCSNKFLGKEDDEESNPNGSGGEKEIYR